MVVAPVAKKSWLVKTFDDISRNSGPDLKHRMDCRTKKGSAGESQE